VMLDHSLRNAPLERHGDLAHARAGGQLQLSQHLLWRLAFSDLQEMGGEGLRLVSVFRRAPRGFFAVRPGGPDGIQVSLLLDPHGVCFIPGRESSCLLIIVEGANGHP
jgi:hypothetical protein